MYLSRVILDVNRRETMEGLWAPQKLHGAIERSFVERQHCLWRIDWLNHNCYLLLLSEIKPDLTGLIKQFGELKSPKSWETIEYFKLLNQVDVGQTWKFRFRGNPVHSSSTERKNKTDRGKLFAHVTPEQQKLWLIERATRLGFSLEENSFDVVNSQWLKFYKGKDGNRPVSLNTVTYEGILTITDKEVFTQTLTKGIGRGKAYGCGLLTIAR